MNIDAKKIFEEVKENHRKLDSCSLHDFSIDITPSKPYMKKFRCTNCSGEVDLTTKSWYEKGLQHGQDALRYKK